MDPVDFDEDMAKYDGVQDFSEIKFDLKWSKSVLRKGGWVLSSDYANFFRSFYVMDLLLNLILDFLFGVSHIREYQNIFLTEKKVAGVLRWNTQGGV